MTELYLAGDNSTHECHITFLASGRNLLGPWKVRFEHCWGWKRSNWREKCVQGDAVAIATRFKALRGLVDLIVSNKKKTPSQQPCKAPYKCQLSCHGNWQESQSNGDIQPKAEAICQVSEFSIIHLFSRKTYILKSTSIRDEPNESFSLIIIIRSSTGTTTAEYHWS